MQQRKLDEAFLSSLYLFFKSKILATKSLSKKLGPVNRKFESWYVYYELYSYPLLCKKQPHDAVA